MLLRSVVIALAAGWVGTAPALASGPAPLAAQGCLGCHGPSGGGSDSIPGIAGRNAADLQAAMLAFRADQRPATIMGRIARGYTDQEIAAISDYFARQR